MLRIKSLLLFFGPLLAPKAIAYYKSARAAPAIYGIPVRPIPTNIYRALFILSVTIVAFLFKALPITSPENIFSLTDSRLQIPSDVLFARLARLRQPGVLTALDQNLRSNINSLESRLLYFRFGPSVITGCQFCTSENPNDYLYYALPTVLAPHLFNLCVLALVTSGLFTGKEGAIWRKTATIAAIAVAFVDIYSVSTYSHQDNSHATRIEDIDAFYWRMRVYRGLAIAALDGLLGWALYLSSTNRAFLKPASAAERVESTTRYIDMVRNKMSTVTILRNTINRDDDLRNRSQEYWVHEGRVMRETMEEREVLEGVNDALSSRINIASITADAETYARSVVEPLMIATP